MGRIGGSFGLVVVLVGCGSGEVGSAPDTDATDAGDTDTDEGSDTSVSEPSSTSSIGEDTSSESSAAGSADTSAADTSAGSSSTGAGDSSDSTGGAAEVLAVDDVYFATQDVALAVDAIDGVLANDEAIDGPLTIAMADGASEGGGVVEVTSDGAIAFTPAAGFWGRDSFAYTAMDVAGNTASASVTIYVAPVSVLLADVAEGHGGFALDGEPTIEDFAGRAVAGIGDFDDDGFDDVAIDVSDRGYIVFGGDTPRSTALSELSAAGEGIVLTGGTGILRRAGDVDGDGIDDVAVAAPYDGPDGSGRVYVVFGGAAPDDLELSEIDALDRGFVIDGVEASDNVGRGVSRAGDVNGDGLGDLIIAGGNPWLADLPDRAYVVFGKAGGGPVEIADVVEGDGGFVLVTEPDHDGITVSGAGDLNGDGLADVLVGAAGYEISNPDPARVYVVFGRVETDPIDLADVAAGIGGFAFDGVNDYDDFGSVVCAAGDVNGDGNADFVVGAPSAPDAIGPGHSYVVLGSGDGAAVDAEDIVAGIGGFVIEGSHEGSTTLTRAAGDVNADGLDDLVVGNVLQSTDTPAPVYVVFGKADTEAVDLADVAAGQGGYVLVTATAPDPFYLTAIGDGAGDFDGDGVDDLVIGLPGLNGYVGRAHVIYGVPTQAP